MSSSQNAMVIWLHGLGDSGAGGRTSRTVALVSYLKSALLRHDVLAIILSSNALDVTSSYVG
eukprot:3691595-Pyramimonas_sp.AAC.1